MAARGPRGRWAAVLAVAVGVGMASAPAPARGADTPARDDAAAQALFNDARSLMAQGRYADACPKLEESQREAPGIGTLFNLADCYEHVDRLASAWATFLKVAAETKLKGQPQREQAARERAQGLEPRLAKLFVDVPSNALVAGLEVKRDGQPVGEPTWGIGVPVDAGEHVVETVAPGKTAWNTTVHVSDGQQLHVRVRAPAEGPSAEAAGAGAGAGAAGSSAGTATTRGGESERSTSDEIAGSGQRTLGWIAIGASVAFVGAGAIGVVEHESSVSDYNSDPSCPPLDSATKPPQCQDRVSSANTWKTVTTIGFIGGGALAVAGVVLLLSAPSAHPVRTASCGGGPGTIGLACGVVF